MARNGEVTFYSSDRPSGRSAWRGSGKGKEEATTWDKALPRIPYHSLGPHCRRNPCTGLPSAYPVKPHSAHGREGRVSIIVYFLCCYGTPKEEQEEMDSERNSISNGGVIGCLLRNRTLYAKILAVLKLTL